MSVIPVQHATQRLLADLLHALGGLGDVADDEVLLGDLHDVGAGNLAQPEQDLGDDAREAVFAVPGGPSKTMWFSLVVEVSSPWAASRPSFRCANGNRWRVAAIDPDTNRLAAERLTDAARVVFAGDYVGEHVTLGYAATVHSAQGVTGERC